VNAIAIVKWRSNVGQSGSQPVLVASGKKEEASLRDAGVSEELACMVV
jgi:hypothetical protein